MNGHSPATSRDLGLWIDQYGPRLRPVARAFAAGAEEADDILQEAWIIAAHRSHLRPKGAPIGAWLYTVTLNVGRSLLRRRKRREGLLGAWNVIGDRPAYVGGSVDVAEELTRLRLWRVVSDLPWLQREVVLLRIVEGMSTKEAAESLNRAEGTVAASLHRAMKRLRKELETPTRVAGDKNRKAG